MFHESLTAHASKTDDSCAYCTGYGKKSALKEMLCSKAKSQKFNAKSMISNMISKWFLKKSLKSSTISLSNFPKFFYSKKKKSQKMIPTLSFYFTLHSHPKNSSTKRFSTFRKKNQSLESLEWRRRKKKKKRLNIHTMDHRVLGLEMSRPWSYPRNRQTHLKSQHATRRGV